MLWDYTVMFMKFCVSKLKKVTCNLWKDTGNLRHHVETILRGLCLISRQKEIFYSGKRLTKKQHIIMS